MELDELNFCNRDVHLTTLIPSAGLNDGLISRGGAFVFGIFLVHFFEMRTKDNPLNGCYLVNLMEHR